MQYFSRLLAGIFFLHELIDPTNPKKFIYKSCRVWRVPRPAYNDPQNPTLETSVTDPLGNTTSYTYDSRGNQLTETDPLGNVTRTTYQDITFGTSVLAKITGQAWLPFSVPLSTTDALGNTTTNAYDNRGRLLSTADASGMVTAFAYDFYGNPTSLAFGGSTMTFEYDGAGNMTRQVDALGNATTYTYDANGNQVSQTTTVTTPAGPRTLVTTTQYDGNSRPVKVTDAEGHVTRTEYDALGNQMAAIDALGRRTEFRYDERGLLPETVFPDATPDRPTILDLRIRRGRSRNRFHRRAGPATNFHYDALGRLTKRSTPMIRQRIVLTTRGPRPSTTRLAR